MQEIPGFNQFSWASGGITRNVYASGEGPVLLLLHEMPHIDEVLVATARRFVAAGFTVYMPSLFGEPLAPRDRVADALALAKVCVRSEFNALISRKPAPITDWIRSLIDECLRLSPHASRLGIIGLCFSGGFALAGAAHRAVVGAVACEPALPFTDGGNIGVDSESVAALQNRLATGELHLRAFRFSGDRISPIKRMCALVRAFPVGFSARCLSDASAGKSLAGGPPHHSVITHNLIDQPGQPTRQVLDHIVAFFKWRLQNPGDPAPPLNIVGAGDCSACNCT